MARVGRDTPGCAFLVERNLRHTGALPSPRRRRLEGWSACAAGSQTAGEAPEVSRQRSCQQHAQRSSGVCLPINSGLSPEKAALSLLGERGEPVKGLFLLSCDDQNPLSLWGEVSCWK